MRFLKFLKWKRTNYKEIDQKKRKPVNYKYWETDTKYSEIAQQF